jgi:AraC-like DNA-binding protein
MVNLKIVKPSRILESCISYYSFCKVTDASTMPRMRVISNSCTTIFIYLNGSRHNGIFNNKPVRIRQGIISPFSLRNDELWLLPDLQKSVECLTIMFTHTGFFKLFGIPMNEIQGCIFDITEFKLKGFRETIDRIEESTENDKRAEILNTYFSKQLINTEKIRDRFRHVDLIITNIQSSNSIRNVRILANNTFTTERTLENWFKSSVGNSPKEFISIIRFQQIIEQIYQCNTEVLDWFNIICKYGYYDQSHFINEFKAATSVTPDYFLKNRKKQLFLASNGSGCLFFADNKDSTIQEKL